MENDAVTHGTSVSQDKPSEENEYSLKRTSEDDIDLNPKRKLSKSQESMIVESMGNQKKNLMGLSLKESFDESDLFPSINLASNSSSGQSKDYTSSYVVSFSPELKSKPVAITSQIPESWSETEPSSISSSYRGSERSFGYDHGSLSTSYCDTESLASLSQSVGSEDLSLSIQGDLKNSHKHKKRKKKKKNVQIVKKLRPNFFVAIQISNPEIHKGVIEVQNSLLSFNEMLFPALIDVAALHITFLVAHIESEDDLHRACSALDFCGASLSHSFSKEPLRLTFGGLSHFSHQTVYAKVIENEQYYRLLSAATLIRKFFNERGISMPDEKDFIPHLTLAKLSKIPRGKGKNSIRKIDSCSYEEHLNKSFGDQVITGLQLLSMNSPKDSDRYYYSSREVLFDFQPSESLDHSLCCHPRQPPTPKLFLSPRKQFHTTATSVCQTESSCISLSKKSVPLPLSSYTFAKLLVGGAALISIAFAISKWTKK